MLSRRTFLATSSTGAAAVTRATAPWARPRAPGDAPRFDDQLPITVNAGRADSARASAAGPFAADDDHILNHALTPAWRAAFRPGAL